MAGSYPTARDESDTLPDRFKVLQDTQRATLNILEDFDEEKTKLRRIQRATMNLLEDFNEERQKYQDIQKATMNLLEDMYEERRRSDEVKAALMNILDDVEIERARAEQAKVQLVSVNTELEAFSYSVSHDLRAPLRALSGFAEAITQDYGPVLNEKGKKYLGYIQENAHIMGQLIDDLLSFSRLSRQQMTAVRIDMVDLAQEIFDEIMTQVQGRSIEFTTHRAPPAFGDRALIKQVLVNLLSNSVKFTRPREPALIEFGHATESRKPAYYVRDNGVGFDMQYAGNLFGVFQRLHSNTEFEGTGVGLALVKRIITRHGGQIWAEAKEGQGATFFFTLPQGKDDA